MADQTQARPSTSGSDDSQISQNLSQLLTRFYRAVDLCEIETAPPGNNVLTDDQEAEMRIAVKDPLVYTLLDISKPQSATLHWVRSKYRNGLHAGERWDESDPYFESDRSRPPEDWATIKRTGLEHIRKLHAGEIPLE